mmetsp:Transcript_19409/g.61756  ORF Transcript_19409/g.61756 Transcript_19409/m.61756 type:complete len:100 (+) Transcript_19409:57-356(+)|eukprot:CAMPEP_0196773552 /NCGR_PEP_ID=MMETSP1104-20130614/2833_1 /TAXON_ID=33652 /ORGANISM="Cafeteria sp., Strain Caron Lab Isolate" /LENGTH=99 /DNA_ID=CAMNT_0042143703 /DNA_START=49 /DNA_END=348 /DNA_ORIENTATION=-
MFTGLPDWVVYVLLLVVATVVAGMIWRIACATLCFVSDLLIPLLKAVLIIGLWILLILLVNKFELVLADWGHLTKDFSTDAHKMVADLTAPLLAGFNLF